MAKPLAERVGETRERECRKCTEPRTFVLGRVTKFPRKIQYFWACIVCGDRHYIDG